MPYRLRENLSTALAATERSLRRAIQGAIEDEANAIMAEAKVLCPVETGALRATGEVEVYWQGDVCKARLSFGGGPVDYAVVQHETPPPTYTHTPPTQWKYLEVPLLGARYGLADRLAAGIARRLR